MSDRRTLPPERIPPATQEDGERSAPSRAWWRAPWQAVLAISVALAFVALLLFGLKAQAPNDKIDAGLAAQKPVRAPKIELPVLADGAVGPALERRWSAAANDGRVSLDELAGVPLVVNFWASWCDPCRREAPTLERAWQTAREHGVLYLGIDQQDGTDDARAFLREHAIDYPSLREGQDDTSRRWGVTGYPETFFVSRRGRVVAHVIGVVSARQLAEGADAARADRPVGVGRGGAQGSR